MDKESKEEIKEGIALLFCPPVLFILFMFSLMIYVVAGWEGVLVTWLIAASISAIFVFGMKKLKLIP